MSLETPSTKCVFVVEDDSETRDALVQLLEGEGYRVLAAEDGRVGIERLRHGATPDLILLDLMLPGMDGWEFRAQQRQDPTLATIPVVVISGTCNVAQAAEALAASGYLQKPVEVDRLLDQVRQVTNAPRVRVLVVEDELGVLKMLGLALRHAGFTVRLTSSGAEAVRLYEQEREGIDVVLLDVQMPGLDGPQTLVRLRQLNPHVHALFMSGHTGKYTPEELLSLGASRVLSKPFRSLTDLAQAVWETAHPG